MRAIILILIVAVVALIVAIQTNLINISQTRDAEAPAISADGSGVTATGGQAPKFEIQTGTVGIGAEPANVTVPVPRVEVRPPAGETPPPAPATTNATQ